jgi:hypothetical protein
MTQKSSPTLALLLVVIVPILGLGRNGHGRR